MGASSLVACWATQRLSTPCWSDAYQVTSLPAGWMEVIIYRLCVNSKGAEVSPPKMIWDQHNAGTCQSHKNKVTRQRTRSQDKISKKKLKVQFAAFSHQFWCLRELVSPHPMLDPSEGPSRTSHRLQDGSKGMFGSQSSWYGGIGQVIPLVPTGELGHPASIPTTRR